METLFVAKEARLRQRDNTLAITIGGVTRSLPVEKIAHVILMAESECNTRLLSLCGRHNVRISVFDYYGHCTGSFEPKDRNPSGQVKLRQAKVLLDERRRMVLAREIVRGAAINLTANLRYYHYRGVDGLKDVLGRMEPWIQRIDAATTTEQLMGVEGNIHQWYFAAWQEIDPALAFGPRVRRPPNNPINCLLSFLNQLTYSVVRHEVSKTHLEESFSMLHAPGHGRASLSLDLAEPFKPVVVDMLIFRMVRRQMVDAGWFEQQGNVCLLSEVGRRHVAEQFSIRLEEKYQGRSMREWIYREAIALERDIMDVADYVSFKRRV